MWWAGLAICCISTHAGLQGSANEEVTDSSRCFIWNGCYWIITTGKIIALNCFGPSIFIVFSIHCIQLTVSILSGYGSSLIKKYYNYDVL